MDTVIVSNSQFYSHFPRQIPKGSVNAEQVEIRLDKSWDGLTVFWHWKNLGTGVENRDLLKDPASPHDIPWEVLTDLGELRMGLVGMDGDTVIKPTIWLSYGYVSDGVDPESGSDPQPPTPSWEQQMVALAEAAANAAKAAKETADNLQASAEAGEFNGDPGPAGPPGKSPIIRNGTWWIWNNDSQDYTDTGVIASGGGGGGVTSYNDLSDRPRIGGVLLEGNKTAEELNLQPKGDYANKTDIPDKLPAPYTLTFAGAMEAAYDGSEDVTVTIPTIAGPPGVSPTVSTEEIDGGTRVTFTFKGGSETFDILNGKTPVKGTDYFTESEIQDVAKQAAALVPGGGGSAPAVEWKLLRTVQIPESPESDQSGIEWIVNSDGTVCGFYFDADEDGMQFEASDIIMIGTGCSVVKSGTAARPPQSDVGINTIFLGKRGNSSGRMYNNIYGCFPLSTNFNFYFRDNREKVGSTAIVNPVLFAGDSNQPLTVPRTNFFVGRIPEPVLQTWQAFGVQLFSPASFSSGSKFSVYGRIEK